MSKKTFALVSGIVTGVTVIAEAIVAYVDFKYKVPVAACIPVVEGAVITCLGFFKEDAAK